jgi:poly-gamma-glutamate synthesis protein (capsule biosynthesis protein)
VALSGQALIEQPPTGAALEQMAALRPLLADADVAFCNLEVAITTEAPSYPAKEAVLHTAPASVLDHLAWLGVTALSVANNHAADLGPLALSAALEEVARRGFLYAGAGADATSAARARTRGAIGLVAVSAGPAPVPGRALDATSGYGPRAGVNALSVRRTVVADRASFAALEYLAERTGQADRMHREAASGRAGTPPGGTLDFYGLRIDLGAYASEHAEVDAAEQAALLVSVAETAATGCQPIVSVHYHDWEPDWSRPPGWLQELAHACVDAGAAIVVGHGPPVTGPLEVYGGRLIAYGLGNLVFHTHRLDGYPQPEVWSGYVLRADLDARGALVRARLHPVQLDRPTKDDLGYARPATRDEARQVWDRARVLSRAFGTRIGPGGEIQWH